MSRPVVITCAITGSQPSFQCHPNIPITPEQIAAQAIDAARAGAAMVHLHVRDPVSGAAVTDTALYRDVAQRIAASGTDVIVNMTTGYGGRFVPSEANPRVADDSQSNLIGPEKRTEHILALRPEVCSLDVATMNFGEQVFMNTPAHLRVMADRIKSVGVKPEIEVFEPGHILLATHLMEQGHLLSPTHFQFCLGIKWSTPATVDAMRFMISLLPQHSTWSAFGISRFQFPMVEAAVELGGHVRVGLEDNLYLAKDVFAPDNAALVKKAAEIITSKECRIASVAEARRLLGMAPRG